MNWIKRGNTYVSGDFVIKPDKPKGYSVYYKDVWFEWGLTVSAVKKSVEETINLNKK